MFETFRHQEGRFIDLRGRAWSSAPRSSAMQYRCVVVGIGLAVTWEGSGLSGTLGLTRWHLPTRLLQSQAEH
jgi:hypothetical protein